MRLALLKAPLPGIKHSLAHRLGTAIDHSQYSHSNIVFANGQSASAWSNGGVNIRQVEYDTKIWDFFTLPGNLEARTHGWFAHHAGVGYDHFGVLRFGIPLLKESQNRFFCHEAIAAALGWSEPWRYGPGLLLARCIDQFGSVLCDGPWPTSSILHPALKEAATQ